LPQGLELGEAQGVVAVGLALEVLELPGGAGGVGGLADEAEFGAEVVDPAGEQAGLDDDDGRPGLFQEFTEAGAVGGEGLEGGGVWAGVAAGDALVFAQVDGQNEASRGGDRDGGGGRGGRGCKLLGG
jgi:hypothetical protein